MAVTDLTDSLPWWARNGSGLAQGPGPTGTPSAAPMGAGGAPGGDSTAWLQYLSQMYGISPQQAMAMMQSGANPADMPSPNASPMAGMTNFGNPAPTNGPGPGNVAPVDVSGHGDGNNPPVSPFAVPPAPPIAASVQQPQPPGSPLSSTFSSFPSPPQQPPGPPAPGPGTMPARPAGVSASGLPLQPGSLAPGALAQFGPGAYVPSPSGGGSMNPAAPPPPGQQAVGGPMASGGAAGTGSTSNPRFIGIDRPNADPTARQGSPQGTALNLAGLFGRGQPAVNPNAPAANAQPVSAQRPVPGPLANAPMPPVMPGDIRNQRVKNAIANPNWWQNL